MQADSSVVRGNNKKGHTKLIMGIIILIVGLALSGGLIFILVRSISCKKKCTGGKCSFFGKCSLDILGNCTFQEGQFVKMDAGNCTPTNDNDGSCNSVCDSLVESTGDATNWVYVKSLGGCVNKGGYSVLKAAEPDWGHAVNGKWESIDDVCGVN